MGWLSLFKHYFMTKTDKEEDLLDDSSVDQVVSDQDQQGQPLFQDLEQRPSPVQIKERFIEVNDQRAEIAQNTIIKRSLNPKRKNSHRLGSVAKKVYRLD